MGPSCEDIRGLLEAARASNPALTFYRGRTRIASLSWAELRSTVEKFAGGLRARGVERGDRVAMLSANRWEVPPFYFAAWWLGAAVVPLNPSDDWQFALAHSRAKILVGERGVAFEDLDGPPPAPEGAADDLALLLYTSGTTGRPKGVALAQRSLVWNAWSMTRRLGMERATQLAVLPLYHAHALGFGLMSSLVTGGHLVLAEKFDPFSWADVINTESVSITSVVPTLLQPLIAARITSERVPTLRALLVSSAPLSAERAREFAATGIPLLHGWGLSEFTNFACCLQPGEPLLDGEMTSVGRPLDGTEVKIIDGELCLRGPSRMIGYDGEPEATRNALHGDWLRSGDQGVCIDGAFSVTGRIKELIIRGGEKYSPLAIERRLLAALPELDGSLVVVGFPHALHGEEVGAYLEISQLDATLKQRLERAARELPVENRPKIILHGAAPIPRTHTGKVQRKKLVPAFSSYNNCRGALTIAPAPFDNAPGSAAPDRSPR